MSFLQKEITLPRLHAPKLQRSRSTQPRTRSAGLRVPGRSSGSVTGLELGATQVVAAQAHLVSGTIVADRAVSHPLPPGLVKDGLVVDVQNLAAELRTFFSEQKLPRKVRVGLATPRTVLRVIDLPPVAESEIGAILPVVAQESIPMPLERAVMDHQTVGVVDTPEGRRLRVIVVAAEREGVATIADTLQKAGLRPAGIDLSIFAAMRAVAGGQDAGGPVLYAQLGDLVNIGIAEHGVCRFTRQAPQGQAMILARLAEQRHVTIEDAQVILTASAGENSTTPSPGDAADVGGLLSRIAGELASELRATAEFYGSQFGETVATGVLTGPLTTLRGFVEALSDASGMSLRAGEARPSSVAALGAVDPRVAPVAVGLAVGALGS